MRQGREVGDSTRMKLQPSPSARVVISNSFIIANFSPLAHNILFQQLSSTKINFSLLMMKSAKIILFYLFVLPRFKLGLDC